MLWELLAPRESVATLLRRQRRDVCTRQTGSGTARHPGPGMSAGHPDHSHVEPTASDPARFASEPGETGPHPGDAVATAPRRYRGCTDHQKQPFGFGFPL